MPRIPTTPRTRSQTAAAAAIASTAEKEQLRQIAKEAITGFPTKITSTPTTCAKI